MVEVIMKCPFCNTEEKIEMEHEYQFKCKGCGKEYMLRYTKHNCGTDFVTLYGKKSQIAI